MTATNNKKLKRKRIWRSIVTTLAAIVVFVTTYALIIPAITWEKTLICPLEEHVHSDGCFNSAGDLTCGKEEHKHTDACFDAPKAAEKVFVCGKVNHIHTEDCYFSDGTLKCTLPEHQHVNACYNMSVRTITSGLASDGAVAEINGLLPITARAEIEAVPLSDTELIMYFGAEKAALMTGYVAYDIKIMVGDAEWQPDESVSVTVKHPNIDLNGGDQLGLAHVEAEDDSVKQVGVQKDENGDIAFHADGFSLYIIYKSFTVDFSYGDYAYSMNGMESIRLSRLFALLCIENDIADVQSVVFSDSSLLHVEPTDDADWLLTSLCAFQTNETLTVVFEDGSEIAIDTTDAITSWTVTWDATNKTATLNVSGKNSSTSKKTIGIQHSSTTTYSSFDVSKSVNGSANYSLEYPIPNNTSLINNYKNWRVSGDKTETLGTIYDLMDSISVSSSVTANYNSATFSDWLESDYAGNPAYRNPSVPTTMAELMTAFDYFYSGRVELPNVWCYHDGDTESYAKLYTLYDATTANDELRDGDIIELHGDTTETKQSVIQKSITLRSDPEAENGKKYTIDYQPTGGYLDYFHVYCDKKADGSQTTESDANGGFFATRDCITVCPDELGTEIEVLFENVVLDGFDAYHKENDIHDYHLLQTIHNVELTLSGVTLQNYNIQSNLDSNGAVSLDGRTTYTAASGDTPAQYGNKIILTNGSVVKNCYSYRGNPYSTGGIMVNSACLDVTDTTFENCSSRSGPAIVVDVNSTVRLHEDTLIQNCRGQEEGAAIKNSGILYIEEGCEIQNCGPQNGYEDTLKGGAVFNKSTGTVYISGGEIKNCTAAEGGAVYNNGTLYVSGGSMTDNTASDDPKDYDGIPATLGSGVYQNGTMYLSGAPVYGADQDVYLPEGRVITKNGEITAEVKIPVVLEDEVRFRDILVSQNEDGKIVSDANLLKLNVKLSKSAIATTTDGKVKSLAAVYSADGLTDPPQGAALNVVELDISDILVVTKVWSGDEEGTVHDPITVYLYKDGITGPVDQLILCEANDWKGIFANIEVAPDGSVPYHVREIAVDDYTTTISKIGFIEGEKPEYWVPADPNAFSNGEFVIYGNGSVLSHNGGTLTKSSPERKSEGITINGSTYDSYFETDQITDNMIWVSGGSNSTLKTKAGTGETSYYLRYSSSSSTLSLNSSSSSNWTMSNGNVRTGSSGSYRYLKLASTPSAVSSSNGPTAITLYQKVEGDPLPGHYEVTITNTKIEYTNLTVNKTWSDGNTDHDPVKVYLYDKATNQKVDEAELSNDNGWSHTFTHILKPGENQPFGYYVIEDFVPGYVSMTGEITEVVANQTYWVPAATNQFSAGTEYLLYSNGYVIERNGSSAIKATAVTRGITVGGVTYPTYISGDEVSDIENTAVWRAERMGSSGSKIAIKNGNYYLRYKSDNPGYQLSTTAGTVTMYNNSKLNLYSGSGDDRSNRYMNISTDGSLSYTSRNSTASAFTLYVKRTITVDASGYEMIIENKEVITDPSTVIDTPDAHKTIDYLGDGETNPDTDLTGENDYRLYLDIDNLTLNEYPQGVDLLLILDGTSSMTTTARTDGDFPVTHMDEIINGSYGPGVTRRSDGLTGNQSDADTYAREADGLVYQFLNMNPNNRVGLIEFSSWSSTNTVIRQNWTTKAQLLGSKADDPKNYYIDVTMAGSGTNYEAGYKRAEELLAQRNSDHPVIMVFMTDGRPNSYIDGNQNKEYKQTDAQREYCNEKGYTLGKRLKDNPANNIISTAVVSIGEAAIEGAEGEHARKMLTAHANAIGGPLLIGDAADTMRDAMFKAVGLVGYAPLKITDELSEYVTFADDLDLKITFEKIGSENKVIWNTDGATSDNVDDGSPIVTDVAIIGDRIEVVFNSSMKLLPLKRITVSYNVTTTQKAQDEYSVGHTYPDTGDAGTDYPGNTTSSEQPGFYSNKQAQVVYRDAFEQYSEDYDHPVVQIPYEPVVPVPPPEIEYPEFGDDDVEIGKQIDYLGNNGIPGMDELYRLYLSLKAEAQPIDLLLVIDQSGSMAKTLAGGTANDTDAISSNDSRQKIMLDFLNGTQQSDGRYNGFIAQFLAANDENDLAILTFDNDSSLDATKRYIHQWGSKADHIDLSTPKGATNYTAALWAANEIWKLEALKEEEEAELLGDDYKAPKKIMIFLSDGEPTYAYSDGKLQRGLVQSTVVGNGYTFNQLGDSISTYLGSFLGDCAQDVDVGGVYYRERTLFGSPRLSAVDDDGEVCSTNKNSISSKADDRVKFPVVCQITGMNVDAPGISDWPLGEIDADVFTPWYNEVVAPALSGSDLTAYQEWVDEGIKSIGDTYDLFWLTEWAYSEFAAANEDVITYTVGFSQETDGKYGEAPAEGEEDTRRERAEVLKYMAGTDPITGESRFFQCNTAEELSEALNSVVLMSVTMTDKLSEYVDFASEENFEITISDAKYADYYEDGKDFAYLYTDGEFTELGEMLLDTEATGIDKTAGTVDVVFKPGVSFNEKLEVEASFNVQLTEKAYDDKETTGYTATGDPFTDYDTENPTSSGENGFFSNDNEKAIATWTRGGEHEENFPKPVVQVPDPVKIWLKKINSETIAITLDGAEFDLYREISSEKEGCITYTDENGGEHYLIKINSETLISNRDTPLELSGLRVGNYYLFETKAPNGYTRLAKPIRFVLGSDAILIDSNEQPNALVDNENLLLLKVINTSSYEFPSTGGIGTEPFYVIGALLMFGALTIGYILWRRREGRGVM